MTESIAASGAIGVDRENKTVKGYVVAQCGDFKSEGRGKFNLASLAKMIELWPKKGLKSRFRHPNLINDGLGTLLGRSVNPRIDGGKLRADLVLDPSSFIAPGGNLGSYILTLAGSDPDAFSSSLVLAADKTYELDENGRPKCDANGDRCSPLWMPTKLWASDAVDTGEAVDGFLGSASPDNSLKEKELKLLEIQGRFLAGECGIAPAKTIAERESELARMKSGFQAI
jgi:hypothetical protein